MKTFKEIKDSKGFKVGVIIFGIAIILLIFIIVLLINIDSDKTKEKRLSKIAATFYSEFYYEQVASNDAERMEVLQKNKDKGISLTALDLSKFSKDDIFKELTKECDLNKTKVIIYPKSPFTKISFDTKVELSCELKKDAKSMTTEKSTSETTTITSKTTKNEPKSE